jgi:hypothetical protein
MDVLFHICIGFVVVPCPWSVSIGNHGFFCLNLVQLFLFVSVATNLRFQHLWVQRSSFGYCTSKLILSGFFTNQSTLCYSHVQCVMCWLWILNAGPKGHPVSTSWCVICRVMARAIWRQLSPRRPGIRSRVGTRKIRGWHRDTSSPLFFCFVLPCCILIHPPIHTYNCSSW